MSSTAASIAARTSARTPRPPSRSVPPTARRPGTPPRDIARRWRRRVVLSLLYPRRERRAAKDARPRPDRPRARREELVAGQGLLLRLVLLERRLRRRALRTLERRGVRSRASPR